jgi:hypothetical protein
VNLSSSGDKCENEAVKIPLASVAAEKERNDIFHSDVTEASVGPVMTRQVQKCVIKERLMLNRSFSCELCSVVLAQVVLIHVEITLQDSLLEVIRTRALFRLLDFLHRWLRLWLWRWTVHDGNAAMPTMAIQATD